MAFLKISPKMSMRRVPIEKFGVPELFYRKVVKINFRGRGPQISTILGLFSKIDHRNFCQVGKKVFFGVSFFLKNRGNKGYFWGCAPNFFLQICTNVAPFQNEVDR